MSVPVYCSRTTWNVLRVMHKLGMLPHLAFTIGAKVMGHKVKIPILRGHGVHGLPMSELWGHHLFPPMLKAFPGTFVDVGVNLGQTLIRLRTVSPNTPYIGFEPNPICVQYTRELVRINGWEGYPIIPTGLGEKDMVLDLVMNNDDTSDSGASLVSGFRPGVKEHHRIPVAVMSFDTAVRSMGIGPLGVVKIDVEGAELEVLLGLSDRFAKDRPGVFLEILPTGRIADKLRLPRQERVEAFFQQHNYQLIRIRNKGKDTRLEPMTGPIGVHDDQDLSNFVAIPAERSAELLPMLEAAMAQQ